MTGVGKGHLTPVNERFFFEWTPEMAYVLGLLITDGYLGDRVGKKRAFQVQLVLTDREIIEAVARTIGFGGKLYHRPPHGLGKKDKWGIKFGNRTTFERLVELNVTPRKSLTMQMPPVPDHLFGHFFRGVFDGNGGLSQSENGRMLRVVGASLSFMRDLKRRAEELSGAQLTWWSSTKLRTPMHSVMAGGYGALTSVYRWMYDDAPPELWIERKRAKLREFVDEWTPEVRGHSVGMVRANHHVEELRRLHLDERVPLKEIARRWGVKYVSVRNMAQEWGVPCRRYGPANAQRCLAM